MNNMIIMGPPGAGKGTQSELIVKEFNVPHISTGDMFREAIQNQTELGQLAKSYTDNGKLVPDEVTIALVKERLSKDDCAHGYLLDGFPRTLVQAEALKKLTKEISREVDVVINITCDYSVLTDRVSGRMVCKKCGNSYHIVTKKPKVAGICDGCGSPLIHRADDTEGAIKVRLDAYESSTKPLVEYYEKEGKLKSVDGLQAIDKVFSDIQKILEGK